MIVWDDEIRGIVFERVTNEMKGKKYILFYAGRQN